MASFKRFGDRVINVDQVCAVVKTAVGVSVYLTNGS